MSDNTVGLLCTNVQHMSDNRFIEYECTAFLIIGLLCRNVQHMSDNRFIE